MGTVVAETPALKLAVPDGSELLRLCQIRIWILCIGLFLPDLLSRMLRLHEIGIQRRVLLGTSSWPQPLPDGLEKNV